MVKKSIALLVFLSCFQIFAQENKPILIGFAEFENKAFAVDKTNYGYQETQFSVDSFLDMVSTALTKTRRFQCIERVRMDELLKEQGMVSAGLISEETGAKSKHIKGVDFILMGSIDKAGIETKTIKTRNFTQKVETFVFGANFRLVDSQTGRIVMSEFVDIKEQLPTSISTGTYSASGSTQNYIADALRKASLQVGFLVANAIDPVVVEATSEKSVKINYGAGFIEVGQIYKILPAGDNAKSGDYGFDEVGRVRIKTVTSKNAIAEIIAGDPSQIQPGFFCQKISAEEEKPYVDLEKAKSREDLGNRFGY